VNNISNIAFGEKTFDIVTLSNKKRQRGKEITYIHFFQTHLINLDVWRLPFSNISLETMVRYFPIAAHTYTISSSHKGGEVVKYSYF